MVFLGSLWFDKVVRKDRFFVIAGGFQTVGLL